MSESSGAKTVFDDILRKAVQLNASDIHLKMGLPPIIRLHGDLKLLSRSIPPLKPEQVIQICQEILPERLKESFRKGHEIDVAYSLQGLGRFRLNIFRHRGQVGLVARFIPYEVKSIDDLGLPRVLKKIAASSRGLIVVTGITGSGKSSTMAALLNEWNSTRSGHIVTIEDPIEYLIKDKKSIVTQREVGLDTESFASGLRHALRQDPDVIMIGELRDKETIQIAMTAAETGHLVLSTLHTKDAVETIDRMVGVFEPDAQQQAKIQVASVLTAVISQRLVPAKEISSNGVGVVCATEILINTPRVKDCLMDPEKQYQLQEALLEGEIDGMHTFDQSLMDLLKRGAITKEVALENATRPADFELKLRGIE